jgi:HEAT repeat protein
VPHLAHSALHDPSVRVRRVAVLALLLQPPARRVARLLRKVLATEQDEKARRVATWGLRQQEKRA